MDKELNPFTRRYLEAQLRGDRAAALRVIVDNAVSAAATVPDLYLYVIQPAQYEIGRLWEESRISVAEEHIASAITRFVISCLVHYSPRAYRNGKKALFGCVEGEHHDIGPLICSDFFEMAGFETRFVGADVPTRCLLHAIERERPDLVGLSVSLPHNLKALGRAAAEVRRAFGAQVTLAAGGLAVQAIPSFSQDLGIVSLGSDALSAAEDAIRLFDPAAGAA